MPRAPVGPESPCGDRKESSPGGLRKATYNVHCSFPYRYHEAFQSGFFSFCSLWLNTAISGFPSPHTPLPFSSSTPHHTTLSLLCAHTHRALLSIFSLPLPSVCVQYPLPSLSFPRLPSCPHTALSPLSHPPHTSYSLRSRPPFPVATYTTHFLLFPSLVTHTALAFFISSLPCLATHTLPLSFLSFSSCFIPPSCPLHTTIVFPPFIHTQWISTLPFLLFLHTHNALPVPFSTQPPPKHHMASSHCPFSPRATVARSLYSLPFFFSTCTDNTILSLSFPPLEEFSVHVWTNAERIPSFPFSTRSTSCLLPFNMHTLPPHPSS
ncbi:uncharacterized protein LOC123383445 [Felis catus]|uniref:uncharacterized protein LOC123383445 n=1 Tax=Felis catus TaxID=9685 RepID=UPI001D198C2E|nr:uncharacterized protein LOC123383445 [Felis catus]